MELHYSEFILSETLQEVITILEPLANKKKLTIEIEVEQDLRMLKADKNKFVQVMYNLTGNAIKFTPENERIRIEAKKKGTIAEISISDNGIGISEENQRKLFRPFVQLDSSSSRQYGGTGLGLALVKEIVMMHGGEIKVQSKEGEGSTFSFSIPINGII